MRSSDGPTSGSTTTTTPRLVDHRQEFDALLRSLAPRLLARHDASRDALVARGHATLKLNVSERPVAATRRCTRKNRIYA